MYNLLDRAGITMKYRSLTQSFFDGVILKNPRAVIICMLAAVVFLGLGIKYFRLDASEETLLLENDTDLKYARQISSRYGGNDFLVLTFKPNEDIFSDRVLSQLERLRDDLKRVSDVESVLTILDVPLLPQLLVLIKPYGKEPKAKHDKEENDQ
jgi:predicted RND superfamily exporter protein